MKKRIFAALAASVMLCGVLTAPAAAETTYKKGDVNMDGEIGPDDSQLVLKEYCTYVVAAIDKHVLSAEQLELANVTGVSREIPDYPERHSDISVEDAQTILMYYTECLAKSSLKETDIMVWGKEKYPNLYK